MTVVVVPGQFLVPAHPVGRLASTLVSVMVAGLAEPARFRRGKTYVAERAVTRLEISSGRIAATVQGSRPTPYHTVIEVTTVERPVLGSNEAFRAHLNSLVPEPSDVVCGCDCPDPGDPCKHAVAALLVMATELVGRPELLLEWRCAPSAEPGRRAELGSRARGAGRHLQVAPAPKLPTPSESNASPPRARTASARDPWDDEHWRAFLGDPPPPPPPVPHEPIPLGRALFGPVDLAAWLDSAHVTLID